MNNPRKTKLLKLTQKEEIENLNKSVRSIYFKLVTKNIPQRNTLALMALLVNPKNVLRRINSNSSQTLLNKNKRKKYFSSHRMSQCCSYIKTRHGKEGRERGRDYEREGRRKEGIPV